MMQPTWSVSQYTRFRQSSQDGFHGSNRVVAVLESPLEVMDNGGAVDARFAYIFLNFREPFSKGFVGIPLYFIASFSNVDIRLWDLTTKKQLHAFAGLGSLVPHVTFSPDGRLLAAASWAGHLTLYDTKSYERRLRIRDVGGVDWAAFSPDQRWLAIATGPTLYVFNVDANADADTRAKVEELLAQLRDDSYETRERATEALAEIGMAAEPRLRQAMRSDAAEVRWRARRLRDRLSKPESAINLKGHKGELESVCFSPDGKLLASGDNAGQVRIWHVGKWSPEGELSITRQPANQD